MAETASSDILKKYAAKVVVPSVSERTKAIKDVVALIEKGDIPEGAVKGIVKYLCQVIGFYRDGASRRAALQLIRSISKTHLEASLKTVSTGLDGLAQCQKNIVNASRSSSGDSLLGLSWTCVVLKDCLKESNGAASMQPLVALQSSLVYGAVLANNKVITKAAYRKLTRVWKEVPGSVEKYAESVSAMEPSLYSIPLISFILKFLAESKSYDLVKKYKEPFLDIYLKQVLSSRTSPSKAIMITSGDLLRHCSHEEYKDKVLPAAQRAVLRNSEVILETVSEMVNGLSLDLSQYAVDTAKLFTASMASKDECTRAVAVQAVKNLAGHCSDPGAIEKMASLLFKVLGGSEGKLSFADQKISVLQGVGNLVYNTVSGNSSLQSLATSVSEMFLPMLQQEVHEGTLTHTLSMLSLWCAKFHTQVPTKLMQWFPKGIALKTSTSSVRSSYIRCMNTAFSSDTILQAAQVLPLLLQTLEKATKQASQAVIMAEAVSASCILVRLSLADISSESKLAPFWSMVLDMKKQYFVNEKFLAAASPEALQNLIYLTERLVLDYPTKMTDEISRPYYKALIHCLCQSNWEVRRVAITVTGKILNMLGGSKISLALIQQFQAFLESPKLTDNLQTSPKSKEEDGGAKGDGETNSQTIRASELALAISIMSRVVNADPRDAEQIAIAALIPAHHPAIVSVKSNTWLNIVRTLKLDPASVVSRLSQDCLDMVCIGDELSEAQKNMVSTLGLVSPSGLVPQLVFYVQNVLGDPALSAITEKQYGIFLTPEDELYDNSIIENAMKTEEGNRNVKKENKLYSYADQMAEQEMRKEIEKKKGIIVKEMPKLTKTQEEQVEVTRQKEKATREKVRKLAQGIQCCCGITEALLKTYSVEMSLCVKDIFQTVYSLLTFPLTAPSMTKLFISIGEKCFASRSFAAAVTYATLRLLDPPCPLDKTWMQEDLGSQISRVVAALHSMTVGSPDDNEGKFDDDEDDDEASKTKYLSGPTFCFFQPLLNNILRGGGGGKGKDSGGSFKGRDVAMVQALEIISAHAKMRRTSEEPDGVDEFDPDLLPRKDLFSVCLYVIGTQASKYQDLASDAILDVSHCANGDIGATEMLPEETEVLLEALESPCTAVREASLQCLLVLTIVLPGMDENEELGLSIAKRIWIACNDPEPHIQKLATRLRTDLGLDDPCKELCQALAKEAVHNEEVVQQGATVALGQVVVVHKNEIPAIFKTLTRLYEDKLKMPPRSKDQFGRVIKEERVDFWQNRIGVAWAIQQMVPLLAQDLIERIFQFYISKGLVDRNPNVQAAMTDSAAAALEAHGKANVETLLPLFESTLKNAPSKATFDPLRQSIVILMGNLARYLDVDNPKVKPIVAQLIAALSTPSQEVQKSVATCLPHLVPSIKADAPGLVSKLLHHLLESDSYGERRGAAFGLAGLIKGMGILALKQQKVMDTLTEAIQDKKKHRKREGALMAFEMLCNMLGRLFEPYIVHIIQHLLLCFGDQQHSVRSAADDCAKAVMRNLSAHGVKLVLPSLLKGLEEDSWRTKAGSVELLGAMAFCAPKQLSACLPSIVPKLTEVLLDSHSVVQNAGSQALQHIGSVIKNPEIQVIVPCMLEALEDPAKHTTTCLEKLLKTKFVHFVDAPSLALMMPVIQRAFQDRTIDTRKMAASIMGNMYSLTDQKDLSPYLPSIIPGLKLCLLDPVPEVRSVSARALGAMVRGMGEDAYQDLLPWLMGKLVSENSVVDRSGAAQGLSEVIGGMGADKLKKLMSDIIQTAERNDIMPHVRDGYIMTYIYLPSVFGNSFVQYVGPILPSILQGLSDENEFVRDTALRAGKRIINQYAETAVELLLPELENGLFDENWRIRNSSVQLLGDLLYKLSGVSGKMSTETAGDDDNFGTETSQKAIMRSLGNERRNRVLSGLYMGRSDTALMVRQNSLHVWKIIVANTPRTLREILPTLFTLLLGCLASTSHDKRTVAARTLGDLVRKLGERVLPEIIPILESGLDSEEADQRQGVCIGLSEIMASTNKDHVVVFADSLIPTVRRALVDPLPEVRGAAAHTFDNLHQNIGQRALDEILPNLLEKLNDPELAEMALDGLTQVMAVRSRVVLPYLVPQLTTPPVNTKALSLLSSVAGEALAKHLGKILPALMSSLSQKIGTPEADQEFIYCKNVVLSVDDPLGVRTILEDLLSEITHNNDASVCQSAVLILHAFCANTSVDVSEYLPQLFRGLIGLFARTDDQLVLASWQCLDAITKKMDLSDTQEHITSVRQAVKFTLSDFKGQELPGFSIPKKGIAPILPIFREGLLNGGADVKEMAALGLGEVIAVTGADALKPSVVNITGPLIRILGDRFSWTLKVAVLDTLSMLLGKVGIMLKPFLPQLQTTFVKAINDPNRMVRLRAASALGKLILIHTRADPLFNELITGLKTSEDTSIKDTFVQALRFCVIGAGAKMADASRKQLTQTLLGLLTSGDDSTRMTGAGCLGSLCICLPDAELRDLVVQHLLDTDPSLEWTVRHSHGMALSVALKVAPAKLWTTDIMKKDIIGAIGKCVAADRIPIIQSGLRTTGHLLKYLLETDAKSPVVAEILTLLVKTMMKNDSNDVKLLVAQVVSFIADARKDRFNNDQTVVPALVMGTKEKNTMVRSASEAALVSVLKLRQGKESVYQEILSSLDRGMQESLKEAMGRCLRKVANQKESPVEEIDDTLLR